MSAVHLPWESLPGPIYTARDVKPRKKWVANGGWVLCAVLLAGGLMTQYRVLLVFCALYVLTMLMVKDTVVTSRGMEIFYQMRITTHYDFLSWDQIEAVIREDRKLPELVALHFGYGDRVKRLFFTKPDAEKIMALAKEQNPKIKVGDADDGKSDAPRKKRKK